jgi:hypothetical protein
MKKLLSLAVVLIGLLHNCFGQFNTEQELLSKVNSHWKSIALTNCEAQRVQQCKTYTDLIQLHLALVTEHLSLVTPSLPLTTESKQKRVTALSELTAYFQKGVFPLNTKYQTPTPIFVDETGTRCAVGQLVYQSGHQNLVNKISKGSNLDFVDQLNEKYIELGMWATENGFSMNELAWIQPQYPLICNPDMDPGEIVNVSCYGGFDGGYKPDFPKLLDPEYDFVFISGDSSFFYFDSTIWIPLKYSDCLQAGLYKQHFYAHNVVTDEYDIIEQFVEIHQPDPIAYNVQVAGDPNHCLGSIGINASGGTPPFDYFLYDENFDTLTNANLCDGVYWIEVKDSHQCSVFDSLHLLSTNVNPTNEEPFIWIFPNPASTEIKVTTNTIFPLSYTIFSQLGQTISKGSLYASDDQIDISTWPNGIYYLVFENASLSERIFTKVVKVSP